MTILGRKPDSTLSAERQSFRPSGSGNPLTMDATCRGLHLMFARGSFATTVAGLGFAFALGRAHANWSRRRFIQSLFTDADLSSLVEDAR